MEDSGMTDTPPESKSNNQEGRHVVTRTEWSASGEARLSGRDDAGINIICWQRGFDRYRKGQGINSSTVLFSLIRLSEKMRQEWRKYDLIIWRIA